MQVKGSLGALAALRNDGSVVCWGNKDAGIWPNVGAQRPQYTFWVSGLLLVFHEAQQCICFSQGILNSLD